MFKKKKSDKSLIKSFLEKKDLNAFSKLYDRYSDKVYGRCLQFFQNKEKAKDATQEIFIKILYQLNTLKEEDYFSTWLYTITYRYCVDKFRKEKKHFFTEEEKTVNVYYEEQEEVFENIYSDILEKGLQKLDKEERTIIMMKYVDEMNIKQISETLNLGTSAIKMRLKRSRDKLISICNILMNKRN
ncbi:RNA polymerase sigma factor [Tenacibaculum maritimum]|uniref:RNA polymerase sigma factor n=1 Tax=Tenacibaculum maritimum TaxID=107401 RepID=UPI0012E60DA1|nr:RNA polymerase sigma factor [Tenacibaculum maritimum]MCD9564208.1 RNA polymerase sigma factor [Tenacibaculum maritimum]MCD9565560.1 RNA polymerase sigma factor [Tenacibaculum maritimum]MCD9579183.1 RNA polymerase sigma factor [Tenacibaculum maritimum]MCD9596093.1 RNA polymerase sigma factor [Tenacibaculum maritimum]MCD9613342.1 RNA polymerase sigma factor [Tenacibaculum maritimum]